jgi:hypothetical protein
VLIDDRADNCAAFASQGGTAVQWKMGSNDLSEVTSRLRQWLDQDRSTDIASAAACATADSGSKGKLASKHAGQSILAG